MTGVLAFGVSHALPSVTRKFVVGGIDVLSTLSGWSAASLWPHAVTTNVALGLCPIAWGLHVRSTGSFWRIVGFGIAAAGFLAQALIGLVRPENIVELHSGYFLWTASSVLMAGAYMTAPVRRPVYDD